MITDHMKLESMRDISQWASDIVERWEGDYIANHSAMMQAIRESMPGWGCVRDDLDWETVERRAIEILNATSLISTTQAAERLGVSRRQIQKMVQSGAIPAQRIGRDLLISPEDLEKVPRDRPRGRVPAVG